MSTKILLHFSMNCIFLYFNCVILTFWNTVHFYWGPTYFILVCQWICLKSSLKHSSLAHASVCEFEHMQLVNQNFSFTIFATVETHWVFILFGSKVRHHRRIQLICITAPLPAFPYWQHPLIRNRCSMCRSTCKLAYVCVWDYVPRPERMVIKFQKTPCFLS